MDEATERCGYFARLYGALEAHARAYQFPLLQHLDPRSHKCFCGSCQLNRLQVEIQETVGFARIGVLVPEEKRDRAFREYHKCYHGTLPERVLAILGTGKLLPPGSTYTDTKGSRQVKINPGHFLNPLVRYNRATKWIETFDPRDKIFFSPSIKYCSCEEYMGKPVRISGFGLFRFAFEVRLKPGYSVGHSTLGRPANHVFSAFVSSDEIEWYAASAEHVITGVMIEECGRWESETTFTNKRMNYKELYPLEVANQLEQAFRSGQTFLRVILNGEDFDVDLRRKTQTNIRQPNHVRTVRCLTPRTLPGLLAEHKPVQASHSAQNVARPLLLLIIFVSLVGAAIFLIRR